MLVPFLFFPLLKLFRRQIFRKNLYSLSQRWSERVSSLLLLHCAMPKAESIHEKPTSRSVTMACLGGVAFFLARCTHSPTQRVAELYYSFSPHQHSDPILPDGVYLLSTPMGRDGNPRGKIQPALYQPGHLLAKHHFSSKREACYHKLRSTYFTLRYFFSRQHLQH